eukprot:1046591-Prymnesium_polylepis.1
MQVTAVGASPLRAACETEPFVCCRGRVSSHSNLCAHVCSDAKMRAASVPCPGVYPCADLIAQIRESSPLLLCPWVHVQERLLGGRRSGRSRSSNRSTSQSLGAAD